MTDTTQPIDHADMVRILAKSGADILASLTPEKTHMWHMASCIPGEAAELHAAVKHSDRINMVEELGDIEFYLEGLRQAWGINREATLQHGNVNYTPLVVAAGELFDVVKKHVIYNKDMSTLTLVEALGDFEIVLEDVRSHNDITREETLLANIKKLSVRYNGLKYSDAAAQARADKDETNAA